MTKNFKRIEFIL